MSDSPFNGYLALPASGAGEPVLVLHAWWGLNQTIRTVCDDLAAEGFAAFAPDLYHGQTTDTIDGAESLSDALGDNWQQARAEVAAAAAFLSRRSGGEREGVAVIGFSLGAFYALDLSNNHPEHVHSVAVFYGTGPDDFSNSRAAYLGHFADDDPYEPAENVDALEALLKQAGRPVTFHRYPKTGHWFFEPDRYDAFNQPAAQLAWQRTLDFLKQSAPTQT